MDNVKIFTDKSELAKAAAKDAIKTLKSAIAEYGEAVWLLAGGTTPEAAYAVIAQKHLDAIDWSRVTFTIGDERIAPLNSPDSNWHTAEKILLKHIPKASFLRPESEKSAENGAGEYEKLLAHLPKTAGGLPRFDLVWLGMGEDGHTLSLFPNHTDFQPTKNLVIPVYNSPKPPDDRISLTLPALVGAQHTVILTSGSSKSDAIKSALQPTNDLPIAQAARITHATWYIDQAAAKSLPK